MLIDITTVTDALGEINVSLQRADGNYRFSDIVLGVVESDQFRLRRVPEAAAETTEITARNAR